VISGDQSLTLSPALAAKLLRSHNAPKDMAFAPDRTPARWLFRPFNASSRLSSDTYQGAGFAHASATRVVFVVYVVLLAGTGLMFKTPCRVASFRPRTSSI